MNHTKIYKDIEAFMARPKSERAFNGVSPAFVEANPNWVWMNSTNEGCWDCDDCSNCFNCFRCYGCESCNFCEDCDSCENMDYCTACSGCANMVDANYAVLGELQD